MTDVRLTALNPEDSQVYPVACNSNGELLTDKVDIGPDIDIEGNLSVGGSATFNGNITAAGNVTVDNNLRVNNNFAVYAAGGNIYEGYNTSSGSSVNTFSVKADGSATFSGDVIVSSRNKQWMLVEQGGLCHMVEAAGLLIDEQFGVDASTSSYPKLRDVFSELDLIEKALSEIMERLRMNPPAGWPVWDGSNKTF
jgi:hypothetical protein